MRTSFLVPLLVVSLAPACTDSPAAPEPELVEPSLGAAVTHTRFSTGPTPSFGSIVCTGERVSGERSSKGHVQQVVNANGTSYAFHDQYRLRLVGVTGRRYLGQGTYNQTFNVQPGQTVHVRAHNKLIAQGEDGDGDDFHYTYSYHFTLTPNGELKHWVSDFEIECR